MAGNRKSPVFVLGCPRSGTTLLYHMLLSAGGFAVYRTESRVFDVLVPRFGDLRFRRNKEKLMDQWLRTHLFERSGLKAQEIRSRVLTECRNGGDFLRLVMESIAHQQKVDRWAECTPRHLLHIREIKRTIPDALIIHIIRDGRDTALSLRKMGWIRPFPWDRRHSLLVAGLYWEWMVRKGRQYGREIAPDYLEVHFEDLVTKPHETLATLGPFINHDLDYDRIQQTAIGSVSKPNTAFGASEKQGFNPVGRWIEWLTQAEVKSLERLVGGALKEWGYPLATPASDLARNFRLQGMKNLYTSFFTIKQWTKINTPLGRFLIDIEWMVQ